MKKLSLLFLVYASLLNSFIVQHEIIHDEENATATIKVTLEPHELVDEKHILVSINTPDIALKNWIVDKKPIASYSPTYKEYVQVYDQSFIITASLENRKKDHEGTTGSLHLTLASSTYPDPEEIIIPIIFQPEGSSKQQNKGIKKSTQSNITHSSKSHYDQSLIAKISSYPYKETIRKVLVETQSLTLQLILALLLGLLLSLTPCIYPMIPITLGVLQSQTQKSVFQNFLTALSYTIGLATTFALMGLLAASSGQAFGYLMASPWFVGVVVVFLAYFAFSLFGFYDLYIPRFLQNKRSVSQSSSLGSAFLFGMASGSVASPCVSPGLALILSMVATLGNKFLGFLLLFAFGFGISTPLLILGTFSGFINMLPRAGMWMLEIQKIFGFMLLSMAIYYLNNILPLFVTMGLLAILCIAMGVYYFYSLNKSDTWVWKIIKNVLGLLTIAAGVMAAVQSFEAWYHPNQTELFDSTACTDYHVALRKARSEKKLLFIDNWTPYCSICKGIVHKILKNPAVTRVLGDHYIVLSVDASDAYKNPYATVREKFKVKGVPYLIVVNPKTEKEITHWQSEMYEMPVSDVEKVLTNLYQDFSSNLDAAETDEPDDQ